MKILEFHNEYHWFAAAANMIITRPVENKSHEELVAASLIDIDQLTRGVAARALKGEFLNVRESRDGAITMRVKSDKNNYRFVHKPIGKVTHTLFTHKSAVDDIIDAGMPRTFLVPGGDDIAMLFARRFARDFSLPFVPEWKDALWDTCRELELVKPLNVWTDPNAHTWLDFQAFEMVPELTEQRAKEVLSELVAINRIQLLEGNTVAPRLSDGLAAGDDLLTYLQTYAPHLAATIEDMAQPAHDLDRPIHPAIATMKRVPFLAQAHVVQAAVNGFQDQRGVVIAADMGTGKTLQSLGITNVLAAMRKERGRSFTVLLLVPSIVVPKWINDEIRKTLPDAIITQFAKWRDVVRWREKRKRQTRWLLGRLSLYFCHGTLPNWACRRRLRSSTKRTISMPFDRWTNIRLRRRCGTRMEFCTSNLVLQTVRG